MMNSLVIFDLFAVIFQILAAWFAYKIYKFDRLSGWWIGLIVAFIFQAIRRLFQAYNDWLNLSTNPLLDRVLMFLISLFLVMGLWEMFRKFENFELIEKKVKGVLKKVKAGNKNEK